MAVYANQGSKDEALRDVLDQLEKAEEEASTEVEAKCWRAAATWLRSVLDRPVADAADNIADMSVTVTWPLRRGEMQMVVFDRDGGPDLGTMTRHDRVIVRTLLRQALDWLQ